MSETENKKPDRRVRKTKALLQKTLLSLLREKKLNDITVLEICEAADINRGTFYLHYRDVFDLYEQIEAAVYNELLESINKFASFDNSTYLKQLRVTLGDIFEYLAEKYDFCIVLFGANRSQEFIDKLLAIAKDYCVENWMKMYSLKNRALVESFYYYTVMGCIALFKHWLDNGRKETPAELARRTELFTASSLDALAKEQKNSV